MTSEFFDPPSDHSVPPDGSWEVIHASRFVIGRTMRKRKFFVLKAAVDHANPVSRIMLEKEFDLTYPLEHPNIRRAYGLEYSADRGIVLVLEYVDGVTLDEFLAQKPNRAVCERIVSELFDALDYLHRKQVVHRDLKPQNILITHNGSRVKLIDLGFSDGDTSAVLKTPAGTRDYMAPELLAGAKTDLRSDIFSLGILFNQYFADTIPRTIRNRCTKNEPNARFSCIAELVSAVQRHRKRKKTKRRWLVVLGIFLLMMVEYVWFVAPKTYPPVRLYLEVPNVDSIVAAHRVTISPPKTKRQTKKSLEPDPFRPVLMLPNAFEGYPVRELGRRLQNAIDSMWNITNQHNRHFESRAQTERQFVDIVEHHFKGLPMCLQKEVALNGVETVLSACKFDR